jgi:phospholipase/carboxylesterase
MEPARPAERAVIWLHGLGADGADFAPLVQQWGLVDALAARFILPHAPVQPVTLNGGMRMRAWFDIYNLDFDDYAEDAAGIERARQQLQALIAREQQRGISSQNILLAGFSQGGAVALHTALRRDEPLAGVLALSTFLPLAERLGQEMRAAPSQLVIRMDHGYQDQVVPFRAAELSRERMRSEGFVVDFHGYAMGHSLCPEQIESLRHWLVSRLTC